jgi:hypothetical protein
MTYNSHNSGHHSSSFSYLKYYGSETDCLRLKVEPDPVYPDRDQLLLSAWVGFTWRQTQNPASEKECREQYGV